MPSVRALSPYLALLALTLAAYLPVWSNDFVDFDDDTYLFNNPNVTNGFTEMGFHWIWTTERAPYRMPLTWLSFQLDAQLFGVRTADGQALVPPAAVHGQNLIWHAANVLLLFGLVRRLSGQTGPSFLIAALFAVHPMHVESVAWAAERKDVLSGFFGLLTLAAYFRFLNRPAWPRYLVALGAYELSLLAKPMLLVLPCLLLLLDYWPLGRVRVFKQAVLARLLLEKLPFFLLAAIAGVLTLESRDEHGSLVSLDRLSFSARLVNALTAYGWYLGRTFYPVRLAALYPHAYENWSLPPAALGAALLLVISVLCLWQARRRPWLLMGWLWFVGTLLPVIGFAQGGRQAWADRFSYWPHIGLFVALVWQLAELARRVRLPGRVAALAGTIVLGWFACLSWNQVGHWRDSGTLWEQTLRVTTNNDSAHERLSRYYRKQEQHAEADLHLAEAVRIQHQRSQQALNGGR